MLVDLRVASLACTGANVVRQIPCRFLPGSWRGSGLRNRILESRLLGRAESSPDYRSAKAQRENRGHCEHKINPMMAIHSVLLRR